MTLNRVSSSFARLLAVISLLVLALTPAACSDDSPGSSDTGGQSDADGGDDTGTPDVELDTGGGDGLVPDLGTEDQGQDAVVDTDDGGGDDVGDGGVDLAEDVEGDVVEGGFPLDDPCDTLECGEDACIGGACVPAIDEETYVAAAVLRDASWISEVQLPSGFGNENADAQSCCFDYTGDDEPDDGLAELLTILALFVEGLDVTINVNEAIMVDQLTLMIDWFDLPDEDGDAAFGLVFGSHTEDTSAFTEEDFEALYASRLTGDEFLIQPASLGPNGPQVQFNNATRTGDLIEAGPSTFPVRFQLPVLGFVEANLRYALIEIDLDADASNGPATEDVATPNACVTEPCDYYDHIDGMRIGGVVAMSDLAATLDEEIVGERDGDGDIIDQSGACACAWGDLANGSDSQIPNDFEFTVTPQDGFMLPSCTGVLPNSGLAEEVPEGFTCDNESPPICASVNLLCTVGNTLRFAGIPDVDLPGGEEGVFDGISVGLYASFTGATFVAPTE